MAEREERSTGVTLRELDGANWRRCRDLAVAPEQRRFVGSTAEYVMLCTYGGDWHPVTIYAAEDMVGFAMWAVDPDDGAFWIGGLLIDQRHQRRGYGRAAVQELIACAARRGHRGVALSYKPDNPAAALYRSLGFVETDEREGDELVARLALPA